MPTVFIPAQLRSLTHGQTQVKVKASTVAEAVARLEEQFPGIRERLCPAGELPAGLQVSIDDRFTRQGLYAPLQPASEVHFLPVIGGG